MEKSRLQPLFTGLICGVYPFVFYLSNNFWAVNSFKHTGYFLLFFLGIPVLYFVFLFQSFRFIPLFKTHKTKLLFISVVMVTATLMSHAMYLTLKKKLLLGLLILSAIAAVKLHRHYKKLLLIVLLMTVLPAFNTLVKLAESTLQNEWRSPPKDSVMEAAFKIKPNIYIIQPDGYVGKDMMESPLYNYDNPFYEWLEQNGFTVYDGFRSNYPASLTSNSSLFAMKQHRFGKTMAPSINMPKAREAIFGESNALSVLKRNGYHTFFIVEDEYFQQNFTRPGFDYHNIHPEEIPFFSDNNSVKKDVFDDLKAAVDTVKTQKPRFYFIEKLLPHHISFSASKEEERLLYLEKIKEVNQWLEKTVSFISEKDPDALIVILADHGGWVGLGSYEEMFSTQNPDQIKTVFSNLAAIKWNGNNPETGKSVLRSNVNLFRVLFAGLAQNQEYLKYTEDDSSYNLKNGFFFNSVRAVIDSDGNVLTGD